MQKVIIYRISDNPRYYDLTDSSTWYEVQAHLDDSEHYLFREVWQLNEVGYYSKMIDSNFIKVVNDNWIKTHSLYYGCQVLNDIEHYNEIELTEYRKIVCNLI